MFKINHFALTIEGIELRYSANNEDNKVFIQQRPACEVLKAIGVIKDYSEDQNNEPVVDTDSKVKQAWCQFIKLFRIDTTIQQKIAEYHNRHRIAY